MDSKYGIFIKSVEEKIHRPPSLNDLLEESLMKCWSSDEWIDLLKYIATTRYENRASRSDTVGTLSSI